MFPKKIGKPIQEQIESASDGLPERIEVGVVFTPKEVNPRWFTWQGRRYKIEEVTYTWTEREGKTRLHFFAVTDGANFFKLCYNSETLRWSLWEVFSDQ
ncbi:hypothetical protein IIA15_07470 [candidate division TA06 bacterium]|nr:hypothetical protein [candidate division TA06 bacterium]